MASRRPLIAGNWKMNGDRAFGLALTNALIVRAAAAPPACAVAICPPATLLAELGARLRGAGVGIALGAQDCAAAAAGAHTGDLSADMLVDAGCRYVIVGHSERRADHRETNALVRTKAEAAIAAGLTPIICVGESRDERVAGRAEAVVARQVSLSLPGAVTDHMVIAYEPVWAIGSGEIPTSAEVAVMHGVIRDRLRRRLKTGAERIPILYGGSMNPGNAASLLAVEDVDGGLVGGASLKAGSFWSICAAVPAP